ncbi:MAG: ABC transporter ATP-binding protein [Fimbriimonadaceae bacterium]|nr:ABC transporter ATP-binding protein [Fimbriimonadaceae bacterium]QYK55664.1 MAG: ABC transporter ATP-binding protein [Fimbriimonadaceae bacterium]
MPLLEVSGLTVEIRGTRILHGVSFSLEPGKTLGVVGESGCGKSMTGLAVMGMLPLGGKVVGGKIELAGRDLTGLRPKDWLDVRGQEVSMVMQDPFTSLNPMMRVGDQIAEVLVLHKGMGWRSARARAVELLGHVGVPAPADSARKYPHQMSGGQRQRVVIAAAFASRPKVLIADEPTTALDVTLQAQILRLLKALQEEAGTAVLIISHDIGVIGSVADEIAVFYAGRVVETGPAEAVLRRPMHPYTQGLLGSIPTIGVDRLQSIPGQPPRFGDLPVGCPFAPRCAHRFNPCDADPTLMPPSEAHRAACWLVPEDMSRQIGAAGGTAD